MLPTDYHTRLAIWLVHVPRVAKGFKQRLFDKGGLRCPGDTVTEQDMHAYVNVHKFMCIIVYLSMKLGVHVRMATSEFVGS